MLKHIAELREKKGVNQTQLAEYLGVTQQTVSFYEKETTTPGVETLEKLADYFDVSTDYILGRTNIPDPYRDKFESELSKYECRMVREYRALDDIGKGYIAVSFDAATRSYKAPNPNPKAKPKSKSTSEK